MQVILLVFSKKVLISIPSFILKIKNPELRVYPPFLLKTIRNGNCYYSQNILKRSHQFLYNPKIPKIQKGFTTKFISIRNEFASLSELFNFYSAFPEIIRKPMIFW